jgi:tetratricopeptide (TPR) repeat protein
MAANSVARWPESPEAGQAFASGDFLRSRTVLEGDYAKCQASKPSADECLSLLISLSNVSGYAGDSSGGERYARAAVSIAERHLSPNHPDLALAWRQLGDRLDQQYREADAETWYQKALQLQERVLKPGAGATIETMNRLIWNLMRQQRGAEAEMIARRVLALRASAQPGGAGEAEGQLALASVLIQLGKTAEAESLYRSGLAMLERSSAPGSEMLGQRYLAFGSYYATQARYGEAEIWYRKGLAYADRFAPTGSLAMHAAAALAGLLDKLERYADAEPYHRRTIRLREDSLRPGHPLVAGAYRDLAWNLASQDRIDEADATFRRMAALRPSFFTVSDLAVIQWNQDYADFLNYYADRPAEALIQYRAAQRGALVRLREAREFDAKAQAELRSFRPIFVNMVEAAWYVRPLSK